MQVQNGRRDSATIEELDEAILNRLINQIVVCEVKKIDGQKYQEVKIIYNFVGEILDMTKGGVIYARNRKRVARLPNNVYLMDRQ